MQQYFVYAFCFLSGQLTLKQLHPKISNRNARQFKLGSEWEKLFTQASGYVNLSFKSKMAIWIFYRCHQKQILIHWFLKTLIKI